MFNDISCLPGQLTWPPPISIRGTGTDSVGYT